MRFSKFSELANAFCQDDLERKSFVSIENYGLACDISGLRLTRQEFRLAVGELFADSSNKDELVRTLGSGENLVLLVELGVCQAKPPKADRPLQVAQIPRGQHQPVQNQQAQNTVPVPQMPQTTFFPQMAQSMPQMAQRMQQQRSRPLFSAAIKQKRQRTCTSCGAWSHYATNCPHARR